MFRILSLSVADCASMLILCTNVSNFILLCPFQTVPLDFIESNITKDSCRVVLQLPDGRVWSVKCYINKKCAKFSAGWKNFATENNLAAGDFCVFELVKERLLNVVIFRVES